MRFLDFIVYRLSNYFIMVYFIAEFTHCHSLSFTNYAGNGQFAGNGNGIPLGDGGPATSAAFGYIFGLWVDSYGVAYLPDVNNCRLRKITATGIITSISNTTCQCNCGGDGKPLSALSVVVWGLWGDSMGYLYYAEIQIGKIRKVSTTGVSNVVTVLSLPRAASLWGSTDNKLYITAGDSDLCQVWKVDLSSSTNSALLVAGAGICGYNGDNIAATSARLNANYGVWVNTNGIVYIADRDNHRIRRVINGIISSIVTVTSNNPLPWDGTMGAGNPYIDQGLFSDVKGDLLGNVYGATSDWRVYMIAPDLTVSVIGNPGFGMRYLWIDVNNVFYVVGSSIYKSLPPSPSCQPSSHPTMQPSRQPVSFPTCQPTAHPSGQPSAQPMNSPSSRPLSIPSSQPTLQPFCHPTSKPTFLPSTIPSQQPSSQPSCVPSSQPNARPSSQPSAYPSQRPSSLPSSQPSIRPSAIPTNHPSSPSSQPSERPTIQPTGFPSSLPTQAPSTQPTSFPSGMPSNQPTSVPTGQPNSLPSSTPTHFPTIQPTVIPSIRPSSIPSVQPSSSPSSQPASVPSSRPTSFPTNQPTTLPTSQPSSIPTIQPSVRPTSRPSRHPSVSPSRLPTGIPTCQPSGLPTVQPTSFPTHFPTTQPTALPTSIPSTTPTSQPSCRPSSQPSEGPTIQPTGFPSSLPTQAPSTQPTSFPSGMPSNQPTSVPTGQPNSLPSSTPTHFPTIQPTVIPSIRPSSIPSVQPSSSPSSQPASVPSSRPTSFPTNQPTTLPTSQPSSIPTIQPSVRPTSRPSRHPSVSPSRLPTGIPTCQPSGLPTVQPTSFPTHFPTTQPTALPTSVPTVIPTTHPTSCPIACPTSQPSRIPSAQPNALPSGQPTGLPSNLPTSCPSNSPSKQPTSLPSFQPTSVPSTQPSSQPTVTPSMQPTSLPSIRPTCNPSSRPSIFHSSRPTFLPSTKPTVFPTAQPASLPTSVPSSFPSTQPTSNPATKPSSRPTAIPSNPPTTFPSSQPTNRPSCSPISKPSSLPSNQPTNKPSSFPTNNPTVQPTSIPLSHPSTFPSSVPSSPPSNFLSSLPSVQPISFPTSRPSIFPSIQPFSHPTRCPSSRPSVSPYSIPSSQPSVHPFSFPSGQPTSQPNSAPSSQPSIIPTTFPTTNGRPPNITSIVLQKQWTTEGISTVQLLITIPRSNDVYIYCSTFLTHYDRSSKALLADGSRKLANSIMTTFQLSVLLPSTNYSVACLTQSTTDLNLLSPVYYSVFQTSCCKQLKFTLSYVTLVTISLTTKQFTFSLSSLPAKNLIVLLNVVSVKGTTHDMGSIIPEKFEVSSIGSALSYSSSFVSGSPGSYRVFVTLSGASSTEYRVNYLNVNFNNFTVITIDTEPPPPTLFNAIFSNDGSYISIYFNQSTNRAGYLNGFPCSLIFTFKGIDSSTCSWIDSSTVKVIQSSTKLSTLLNITDAVHLKSNTNLRASCPAQINATVCNKWKAAVSKVVYILPPANPSLPVVQISAPSNLSSCQPFSLDLTSSSGNAGRPWSHIIISIDSTPRDMTNLNGLNHYFAKNYTFSPPGVIAGSLMKRGTLYTFTLKLCNFLGACNSNSFKLSVAHEDSKVIPVVSIAGSSLLSVNRNLPVQVNAIAFTQVCGESPIYSGLAFEWNLQVIKGNVSSLLLSSIKSSSKNPSIYLLPSYTLPPGIIYKLQLTVRSLNYLTSSSALVTINVLKGNLHAIIKGGNKQVLQFSYLYVLDGSLSYDEDNKDFTGNAADLFYQWSCYQLAITSSRNCSSSLRITKADTGGDKMFLYPFEITSLNATYQIIMTVYDASKSRSSSATVELSVSTDAINILNIVTSPQSVASFSTSNSLIIKSSLEILTPCLASWKVNDPSINLQTISSTSTTQKFTIGSQLPFNLRINPNTLPLRSTISFELSCGQRSSSITVTTNGPPIPGSFICNPKNGTELKTKFSLFASSWSDPDLPITFQFGVFSPQTQSNMILVSRSSLSSLITTLPAGDALNNFQINCTLQVFDVFNASTISSQFPVVKALPSSNSFAQIASLLSDQSASQSVDGQKAILSVATLILNRINCTVSVNCTSLNRLGCSSTPNTCGKCISGYQGDSGDKNSRCISALQFSRKASNHSNSGICNSDNDCIIGLQTCLSHQCIYNQKKCPLDCSNKGICNYFYVSTGQKVDDCKLNDLFCQGICDCHSGYSGSGCSIDEANLPQLQVARSALVATLKNLTQNDIVTTETVSSWSSYLSAVSSNPYELPLNDLSTVEDIALGTVTQAIAQGLDSSQLSGVLDAVDGIATVKSSFSSSSNKNNNNTNVANGLMKVISKFSEIISNNIVFGEPTVDYVYTNFRITANAIYLPSSLTDSVDSQRTNFSLNVARTEIEELLGISTSKILLVSNQNNSFGSRQNSSTFSASLIQTYQKSYTNNVNSFYSDPLRIQLTSTEKNTDQFLSSGVLSSLLFHIQNNEAAGGFTFGNITKQNFTSSCVLHEITNRTFRCPYSDRLLHHSCNGSFEGTLLSYCPKVMPSCNSVNVTSAQVSSALSRCTLLNYTEAETICSCTLLPSASSGTGNSSRRRLTGKSSSADSAVLDDSGVTNLVAATEFFIDDFTSTFSAADALNSPDGATKATVMIILIGSIWGIGIVAFLGANFHEQYSYQDKDYSLEHKHKKRDDQNNGNNPKTGDNDEENEEHHEVMTLAQRTRKQILGYVEMIMPAVYNFQESFLQRTLRELGLHHRYLRLFLVDKRKQDISDRIYRTVKILTIQTLIMFLQAILFDLQNPDDDGTCKLNSTEMSCLGRKTPLDHSQSYCQWIPSQEPHCQFHPPIFSEQAVIYVMIITAVCTAVLKLPIDMALKIWICPTSDLHKQKETTKPGSNPEDSKKSNKVVPIDILEENNVDYQLAGVDSLKPASVKSTTKDTIGKYIQRYFKKKKQHRGKKIKQTRSIPLEVVKRHHVSHHNFSKMEDTVTRFLDEEGENDFDDDESENSTVIQNSIAAEEMSQTRDDKHETNLIRLFFASSLNNDYNSNDSVEILLRKLCQGILRNRLEMISIIEQRKALVDDQNRIHHSDHFPNKHIAASHQLVRQYEKMLLLYDQQWGIKPDFHSKFAVLNLVHSDEKNYEIAFELKAVEIYRKLFTHFQAELERQRNIFKYLNNVSAGMELMYFFVIDLLGQTTPAAKIFRSKFNEDFEVMMIVNRWTKYICIAFIFLLNGFFIYYMLLKGAYKGYDWQLQYCQAVLTQFAIELLLFETLECVFIHYLIPESVRVDVKKAIYVLETIAANVEQLLDQKEQLPTTATTTRHQRRRESSLATYSRRKTRKASYLSLKSRTSGRSKSVFEDDVNIHQLRNKFIEESQQQHEADIGKQRDHDDDEDENEEEEEEKFDSSKYLFLSKQLCQLKPELIETRIILSYHNHFPGMICHTWSHYKKAAQQDYEKTHGTVFTRVKSFLLGFKTESKVLPTDSRYLSHTDSDIHNQLKLSQNESNRVIQRIYGFLFHFGFIIISSLAAGILYTLQLLGILPAMFQRIFIRMFQSSTLSGLTILWYNAQRQKSYFSLFGVILMMIVVCTAIRFAFVEKDSKADAFLNQKLMKLKKKLEVNPVPALEEKTPPSQENNNQPGRRNTLRSRSSSIASSISSKKEAEGKYEQNNNNNSELALKLSELFDDMLLNAELESETMNDLQEMGSPDCSSYGKEEMAISHFLAQRQFSLLNSPGPKNVSPIKNSRLLSKFINLEDIENEEEIESEEEDLDEEMGSQSLKSAITNQFDEEGGIIQHSFKIHETEHLHQFVNQLSFLMNYDTPLNNNNNRSNVYKSSSVDDGIIPSSFEDTMNCAPAVTPSPLGSSFISE
jgi:hypothetical protein